ncbi:N-acetylmuramidase domain-containing protein [Bacteroides mediterraneensis]|uniref:DUF3380 domain-containing protein n=1 Tax=Bacteroides mediterraneensis TaxID=1841856 RepID=A0ABS2EXJ9_9BACE|nr:DUF3380 domain-containing protein [Bacteroides mediterraneensis]
MTKKLQKKWKQFNGPSYKQNKYDEKLQSAYNSFKGK